MSLLGFITGVGSIISGLRGSSEKSSSTTNSNVKTAQSGQSNTTGSLTQNGTTTGSQQQTGTQAQTGTVTNSGGSTSNVTGNETQQSQTGQTTTNYSSDVLASLDSLLKQQLAGGGAQIQQAQDALGGRLQQIQAIAGQPQFDVNNFVSGIASQAAAATQSDLDSRINTMLSASGSSETGNSMSALLGNRLRNEAAANFAGIVSGAQAQGTQIAQAQQESITGQISGLAGGLGSQLATLLGATQGAQSTTTGQSTSTGQSTQQAQETTFQKQIQDLLTSLTQNTNTTQTESSTANQTQSTKESQIGEQTTNSATKGKTSSSGDIFGNIAKLFSSSQAAA